MGASVVDRLPSRRRTVQVLLAVYTALILLVTMWPRPVTEGANKDLIDTVLETAHNAGVSEAFNFHSLQFVANIVMFVPFGFLLALLLRTQALWVAVLAAPLLTTLIETIQEFFLPARSADVWDVVANSVGGWIGVALVVLWRLLAPRQRVVTSTP